MTDTQASRENVIDEKPVDEKPVDESAVDTDTANDRVAEQTAADESPTEPATDEDSQPGDVSRETWPTTKPAADDKSERQPLDQLEREGDIAADYLERLLDVADLDGDIDVDIDGDRAAVAIVDSDEGRVPRRLVGREGEVLDALQELTRLAVLAATGERSRLMLDIAGHRAARRATLVARAREAVTQVRSSGAQLALEPMTPFERKVVHDAVAVEGLATQSEGVEPNRHVVVLPG